MKQFVSSLALLVGGVVLLTIDINATNSFSSDVSWFFTGSPQERCEGSARGVHQHQSLKRSFYEKQTKQNETR
jgi:hypothetical protein